MRPAVPAPGVGRPGSGGRRWGQASPTTVAALLAVSVGLSGCATVEEHSPAGAGIGVGTAARPPLDGLVARPSAGVISGGLRGTLLGGTVGGYLEREDRNRAQAIAATGYTVAQGNVLRVDRVQVEPRAARPGDTVQLLVSFTMLTTSPTESMLIRETREVRHHYALVADPATEASRSSGTFTSALPITLPGNVARGLYEVTAIVASGGYLSRGTSRFTVR